jgi:hypothetical protein
LAWAFLRWALQQQPGLRSQVMHTFDTVRAQYDLGADEGSATLADHGLLSAAVRQEIRARALLEVIQPCVATLLDSVTLRCAA